MQLRVKRVTEAPSEEDGARVLVDRLWPRGQSKDKVHLDAWLKEIAPGDALRKWFNHEPEKWDGFRERYAKELDANPDAVKSLQEIVREHGTVTLLFGSHEARYNNAVALNLYMSKHMPRKRSTAK